MIKNLIASLSKERPVLIAGPTATGKSALAMAIAEAQDRIIVNADASQVYNCWRIITARPSMEEEKCAPHFLYGHISYDTEYSTGHWLKSIKLLIKDNKPVIVGGTGLYFNALTKGLADIPTTPTEIRLIGNTLSLEKLVNEIDQETISRIDLANRARVQRAWEVQKFTGRSLTSWQKDTGPPILRKSEYTGIVLNSTKDWLNHRIENRFNHIIDNGGLDEAKAMLNRFDPSLPSCKAIGAVEAIGVITGKITRNEAVEAASIATRKYAKRQRTWFRSHMAEWVQVETT
ncbi:MAG: tRNA (adenosine(37)-N6)-dimethylallyltransferase MiaA [Tateyamaria sp.]|nr:tRNA (adenosine(37)-N6)-dimethylallyltransferase MiaA [Tateyamaria sp.]MDG1419772.1 tRNA (adenosine(37)-N6)-dimethylallyltransferase MiaA [Tateyamaria sp.]MDG1677699.1 tRNA (adenosine(37)-N6)-dimethylallyltransferase MiaA [Tateyamaria sp.]MDG2378152.1 tRNA (adenosine(37)-N6)-dimethylallyltransferase MiaA [Tateyamaria sp.]